MLNRDPIFKGATRPAMMAGVPIVPFILVVGFHLLLAIWAMMLINLFVSFVILMTCVLCIFLLRYISSQDDQRLNQFLLRMKSVAGRRNNHHWGAHSVAPTEYTKRKQDHP
jgi:type IV secretion system protein VirB3